MPHVSGKTLDTYISEISASHARLTGYTFFRSKLLEDCITRFTQLPPPRPRSIKPHLIKLPVNKSIVRSILSDPLLPLSVKAAVVLGFDGMLRVEEYTAAKRGEAHADFTLLRSDIHATTSRKIFTIRIKRSKSDPSFQGPQFAVKDTGSKSNAFSILSQYLNWFDSRFDHHSPLFRLPNGSFVVRSDIDAAISKHAAMLGFNPAQFSTHGLRYGGAFELAEYYVKLGLPINWSNIISRGRWRGESAASLAQHYARFSEGRLSEIEAALDLSTDGADILPVLF